MQYTTDQLIQLLEEARGYVHDAAMGALWTKEWYAKLTDFMERTNVVEYQSDDGYNMEKSLQPFKKKLVTGKGVVDINPADANGLTPEQVAHNLTVDGYTGGFLSIEDEVKNLREKDKLPYGRDFLRKVVKILREHPVQKITSPTGKIFTLTMPPKITPQTFDKVFGPSPVEKAQDMLQLGYKSTGGSIDEEVGYLREDNYQGSRDFLRAVVKIIRSKQGISK